MPQERPKEIAKREEKKKKRGIPWQKFLWPDKLENASEADFFLQNFSVPWADFLSNFISSLVLRILNSDFFKKGKWFFCLFFGNYFPFVSSKF